MAGSQSLYREYRPQRFAEVLGQDHVTRALLNAVREGRVGHAYLFSGPRGTGKTSTARILAKVLNCERPEAGEPCGTCASCVAVAAGTSFDVHEHDSASARGIHELKAILDTVHLGTPGRTKVYILDEVHMLTREAVSALLKTLEEPPDNVVFVLATTDPQKVPDTIRSRTQHFPFHLLGMEVLADHVRDVARRSGLGVDDDAVAAVLREGRGSARDTLSALDRVAAGGRVDDDHEIIEQVVEALAERDTGLALVSLARATAAGHDARTLADRLVVELRDAFLSLFAPELVARPEADRAALAERATRLGRAGATRAIELLGEVLVEMRHAPDPRLLLDVALVRLTRADVDPSPAALAERIERLEQRLSAGVPSLAAGPPAVSGPERIPSAAGTAAPAPAAPAAPAREEAADEPAGEPPSGGGIAAARAVLGSARAARGGPAAAAPPRPAAPASAGRRPAPGSAAAAPPAGPAPDPADLVGGTPADVAPAAAAATTAAAAPTGLPPLDRDQLTLAWSDSVVGRLKPGTKGRFLAGRFLAVDGDTAEFALPNAAHRDKCEPLRGEVEAALSAHFGRPVRLRLVAEPAGGGGAPGDPAGRSADERYDLDDPSELVDAPSVPVRTPLDHLTEAFPGAKLIVDDGA